MSLSIGIVGLPNVGKSTSFNALTRAQNAQVANYPFCTIEPNKAIVPVPDQRVERLVEMLGVPKAIHATIEFVDIAGLVKGASQGEGLGNQFLGNIRDTSAIVHVVRCFEDENVVHVSADLDPINDIEVINTELLLADLEQITRKIDKLEKQARADKNARPLLEMAQTVLTHLDQGQPVRLFPNRDDDLFLELNHELRLLTGKPVIYIANVSEDGLSTDSATFQAVQKIAAQHDAEVVKLCAKLEEEMADLPDAERMEFMELSGITESGLEQVIHKCYHQLGLISFFTRNENEVRAWDIRRGTTAPGAAGTIHTDFERGFIKAEVVPFETLVKHGSDQAVKAAGALEIHGKDYVVQDGDVILFRFNV